MKKQTCDRKKLNNEGLTLVEILVAFVILTVSIVALIYGFTYAMRINAKARDRQQTSVLAHTIIENCKAYSLEEIETAVGNGTFLADADSNIKDTDTTHYGTGEYLYHFDNVKVYDDGAGNASNQIYDISVLIQPHGSTQNMMYTTDINEYKDAVFMADDATTIGGPPTYKAVELDALAYETALTLIQTAVKTDSGDTVVLSTDEIRNSFESGGSNAGRLAIKREIYITAGTTGTPAYDNVSVVYEYKCVITDDKYIYEKPDPSQPTGYSTEEVELNCDTWTIGGTFPNIYKNENTVAVAPLEKIYFFYYPAYSTLTAYPFASDSITINNNLGRDIDIYLMKQKSTVMTDVEITIAESNYAPIIKGVVSDTAYKINMYHNQSTNLGSSSSSTGWGISQLQGWINPAENIDGDSLIVEEPKQLMYKVKVNVFDSAAYNSTDMTMSGDALASMEGTFLNW